MNHYYARQILDSKLRENGPLKDVSIIELEKTADSRAAAKASDFICHCKTCDASVIPVFTKKEVESRRNSPCSYFRAKHADSHKPGCPHRRIDATQKDNSGETREGRSKRSVAPTIFVENAPSKDSTTHRMADTNTYVTDEDGDSHRGSRKSEPGDLLGDTRAHELRQLAEAWHFGLDGIRKSPLHVPKCVGATYGDIFKEINAESALVLAPQSARKIYWNSGFSVIPKTSGFEIRLGLRNSRKQFLTIFIPLTIDQTILSDTVVDRLNRISDGIVGTVYVLGSFVLSNTGKAINLEPSTTRHVWVEIGAPETP